MTAAIYGRVSTVKQDYQLQVEELKAYAERMGWERVEYLEKESAKTGSNRPQLKKLLADAALHKFDIVLVWKLDRFGRSVSEFSQNIIALDNMGVRFIACSQGLDTDKRSPTSKLLINILVSVAEFELDMIHERVQEGVDHYRKLYAAGKVGVGKQRQSKSKENKPHGRPKKIFRRDVAQQMLDRGMSLRAVARELGVKRTTLRRGLQQAA